jgi:hypothetical protein
MNPARLMVGPIKHRLVASSGVRSNENKAGPEKGMTITVIFHQLRMSTKKKVIHVRRSIVKQKIGPPKTEASQKPVPVNPELAKALRLWKMKTIYNRPDDWVLAPSLSLSASATPYRTYRSPVQNWSQPLLICGLSSYVALSFSPQPRPPTAYPNAT